MMFNDGIIRGLRLLLSLMRLRRVMLGYLYNPTATAKTIIDGFVHAGDIAWRDDVGNVYIVDRLKELIKAKGFQVAPAELEGLLLLTLIGLLLQHPLLADAAVIRKPDERSGEVLVAFVIKRAVVAAAAAAASGTKPPVLPEK